MYIWYLILETLLGNNAQQVNKEKAEKRVFLKANVTRMVKFKLCILSFLNFNAKNNSVNGA